jgi:sigma-B regulation protein RsbU (phosphoserine phosphatase)
MAIKVFKNFSLSATIQGVLVVVVALVTLEVGSLLQYNQTKDIVEKDAYRRAQDNIDMVENEFNLMAELVESAVRNNMWSARALTTMPDSLWSLTRGIVADNPVVYGSAIALVENYNPRKSGHFFAPYAYRDGDKIKSVQLGTSEYDYTNQEWFVEALTAGDAGHWSEPYFDEGGGNKLMTTYSRPVYDHSGRLAAVLTADVALDWVSDRLAALEDYPYALKLLVSKNGTIMATSPASVGLDRRNIIDLADSMEDGEDFREVNRAMLAGEQGGRIVHLNGVEYHVFYDMIQKTGWAMSMSVPEEEIFSEVSEMNEKVLGIQLVGIIMLIVILLVTVYNQRKLVKVNEKKNRMDSELHVARGIQMAMVPKLFPPFPERKDVDIFASLIPAKEVGGDLFDFFIRDERLYFCIGDVSGKGVPASLVMAVTRSLFRTVAGHEKSPVRIVSSINENLAEMNDSEMFVTFFCGVLDMQTGHLRYCNAGHNAPVLLGDNTASLPVVPNLPLGVMSHMSFVEQEADLTSGTGIFLYTDGLTEAEDAAHNQFGEERMMREMNPGATATEMIQRMTRAVQAFVGDAPQSDDLTMLHIRYLNDTPMEKTERHLILHNDIQQIPQLAEFVETVSALAHLSGSMSMSLNLALEEAVTNVILYAYPEGADGLVDVEAIIRKDELQFIVTDSGKPFDPTAAPEADITLDVEDRPIGGLGIFLVRNIMDSVRYERVEGKNILTMSKNLL